MLENQVYSPFDGAGNSGAEKPGKVDLGNAQELVAKLGAPFTTLFRKDRPGLPYGRDRWEYDAFVTVNVNGDEKEGAELGTGTLSEAYGRAYADALRAQFPTVLSGKVSWPSFKPGSGENSYLEMGFETEAYKWVSRHEGDPATADVGALVEAGMMVAVHLDLGTVK